MTSTYSSSEPLEIMSPVLYGSTTSRSVQLPSNVTEPPELFARYQPGDVTRRLWMLVHASGRGAPFTSSHPPNRGGVELTAQPGQKAGGSLQSAPPDGVVNSAPVSQPYESGAVSSISCIALLKTAPRVDARAPPAYCGHSASSSLYWGVFTQGWPVQEHDPYSCRLGRKSVLTGHSSALSVWGSHDAQSSGHASHSSEQLVPFVPSADSHGCPPSVQPPLWQNASQLSLSMNV